jgi:putative membrane protein
MQLISNIFIALVAIEHLYILWLEMFVWTTLGKKVFRTIPPDMFEKTKTMAANQGLYNGFLAAGLIWSLLINNTQWSRHIAIFFLSCVLLAGIFGGMTVHKSIFIKQGIPALLALIFTILNAYI